MRLLTYQCVDFNLLKDIGKEYFDLDPTSGLNTRLPCDYGTALSRLKFSGNLIDLTYLVVVDQSLYIFLLRADLYKESCAYEGKTVVIFKGNPFQLRSLILSAKTMDEQRFVFGLYDSLIGLGFKSLFEDCRINRNKDGVVVITED